MTLAAGTMLGRYRIESLVGQGGMGAVYLATDIQLERRVALKILSSELAEDERFRQRFMAESRIAASLDHPNIVPVYEAGDVDGQLFIAMRYIDGHDVSDVIAKRGSLPTQLIVRIVTGVAAALDAAHDRNLVHRDVKPGNVLLAGPDDAPIVYLTDFGLTKRIGTQTMTTAGQIVGSIGYVAPEQVEGRPIDRRTDIYSLGCLTYEMFSGVQPFRHESEMATLLAHVQDPPPSLVAHRPELPEALDASVARAMAKDPEARFATAGEFAKAVATSVQPDAGAVTRGFLFADLRGYTAYVESHGDSVASALLDAYRRMMRQAIARHGGAEIKTEGDSFYVVFPSASGAVKCGLSIVAAAAAHSQADPDHPIRVGVGINAGEAVAADEGYVGSAVNIAARVCAQAQPGEVLVTATVRGLTRTSGQLTFTPVGRRKLKGIAEPIALFHVEPQRDLDAAVQSGRRALARPSRHIVALGAGSVAALAILLVAANAFGLLGLRPRAGSPPTLTRVDRLVYAAIPSQHRKGTPSCDEGWETRLVVATPSGAEGVRLLRPGDEWETRPAWSPDGSMVAFVGIDDRDVASLYVVASSGSGLRNLTPTVPAGVDPDSRTIPSRPSWSTDSKRILFSYGANGIWIVNADGSGLRRLIAPLSAPSPIPDPDGNTPDVFPPQFGAATWMPDGRIAVDVTDQTKDSNAHAVLYVAAADGSGLAPLPGMPTDVDLSAAAWAPDGRLAFVSYTPAANPDQHAVGDLYILEPGSTVPKRVPGTTGITAAAAWSPDASHLAFAAGSLFTIRPDGTDRRPVATQPGVIACGVDWGRVPTTLAPRPTNTPAPSGAQPAQPFHRGELTPGTYVTEQFVPRLQFRVDAGWYALLNFVDGFALGRTDASVEEELDVGRVQVVYDTPCLTGKTRTIGPSAREFFDFLGKNHFLHVGNPQAIVIGGKTGLSVDVTLVKTPPAATCPDEPEQLLNRVWLFEIGETSFWFRAGQRVRITSVDAGDGPAVTFVYGGDIKEADAFIASAQRVIESLTFP